jgi:hypothetical protein
VKLMKHFKGAQAIKTDAESTCWLSRAAKEMEFHSLFSYFPRFYISCI